jgi:methionyl-tRNA formyltransferase
MRAKPSVILLGAKPAAVAALSVFIERGWNVKYVVTARNFDLAWYGGEALEAFALRHGLKVMSQAELPRDSTVDFVLSYQFRNRVKPDVLALARRAAVNFHCAPLPEFGGFAFYNVAILDNVSVYGCSCHYMNEDFDTGPLLKVRHFPIDAKKETAYSLEAKSQDEMVRLFIEFCELAESGNELPCEPQDPSRMRYLNVRQMEALKEIPSHADAETIDRRARAFWYPPYEAAYIWNNGEKIEVVPQIVKQDLARILHADDLDRLMAVAKDHQTRARSG